MTVARGVAVLLAVALSGCGAGDGGFDLALPLDAYDLSAAERRVVDEARFRLLADCTRAYGVELKPSPPSARGPEEHRNAAYLGWLGDREVEIYGYAGPPSPPVVDHTTYPVSDEQLVVLEGKRRKFRGKDVPPGGCLRRTEAILDQGATDLLGGRTARVREEQDFFLLANDASGQASADARVRRAEQVWSDCMKDEGFDYPYAGAAVADPRWARTAKSAQPRKVTAAEIATATADVACRDATGYYAARRAAYRDSQQQIIAGNQARLDRIKIINRVQLENARTYLAGELVTTW